MARAWIALNFLMNNNLPLKAKFFFILVFLVYSLSACVDQIKFEEASDIKDFPLIIEGKVTLGKGPFLVKISRFNGDIPAAVENAEVFLLNGKGEKEPFLYSDEGIYKAKGEVIQGEIGESYQLEILLNGKHYLSRPEIMPTPARLDSLSVETADKEVGVTGGFLLQTFVNVNINATLPVVEDGPFLRWTVREAWKLTETQSPNPLARPKVCYFEGKIRPQSPLLFNGNQVLTRELVNFPFFDRLADWSFGERHVFYVQQSTTTAGAFDYWQDVDLVVNQNGSIFDAPPAALPGNVYNVDDSLELVLGYFEAAAVDTLNFPVYKFDLAPFDVVERCFPSYLDYNFGARQPFECYNCLFIDGASLTRPEGF